MKRIFSLLLALVMALGLMLPGADAAGAFEGKTVLICTANLRGDVSVYPQIAAWKRYYEAEGADVVLVDGGNCLQGSRFANFDRGESIYELMDAVGYDVAVMDCYDYVYGKATTGYPYHGNFHRYYTQAELAEGCGELTYNVSSTLTATRPAREPVRFTVIGSEFSSAGDCYSFSDSTSVTTGSGLTIGFYGIHRGGSARDMVQDGLLDGAVPASTEQRLAELTHCDLVVGLETGSDRSTDLSENRIAANGQAVYLIDNETLQCTACNPPEVEPDAEIAAMAEAVKSKAGEAVFTSQVTLDGADHANRNRETNLGDLVTDALQWYAENKFEGLTLDAPVVALQNGGNCDQFLYPGDVTAADLLCALPFSPMGVGVLRVTGAELLETLEAAACAPDCPGFAQTAGLEYTVRTYEEFDAGEAYGKFFRVGSINRVSIESVGGRPFDENASYLVIADNYLMNGSDTYYLFKEIREAHPDRYLNNGSGVKTRDIVSMYVHQALGGSIGSQYAQADSRIAIWDEEPYQCPFTDVAEGAWYYDAVVRCHQAGLMSGTSDTTFSPRGLMTRGMLVTVLYRLYGAPDASALENVFSDVDENAYYAEAVCWAAANGIVNGVAPGVFKPNAPVTREQTATILYRFRSFSAAAPEEPEQWPQFPDSQQVHSYAQQAIRWATGVGLLRGLPVDGVDHLLPGGTASRAQMAVMLIRFMDLPS